MVKAYLYAFSRFYNSSFQRAPGLTLALTNGALSGVADVVVRRPSLPPPCQPALLLAQS